VIEVVRRFLRQRFGSPAMATALGVLALLTAIQAALSEPERALESGFLAIVLIAAGSVSRDASSGALQMILARPIRRTSYLFGRYLGILAAYAAFLAGTCGLTVLLAVVLPRALGAVSSSAVSPESLARGVGAALLNASLFASILLFFSTFLRGYADVLAYILLSILLQVVPGLGRTLHKSWLTSAGEEARRNVLPEVDWSEVLRGRHALGEPTGQFVLAVVVFLTVAALIFSRREFSYGRD
jgi:ABC-type transport system involved in multi-copper enzyme maturation permease subunit